MGKKVAEHQGAHYYTVGQRKGLHIGGRPLPSFVIGIDTVNNLVFSGQTDEHNGLNKYALKIHNQEVHWINLKHKLKKKMGSTSCFHQKKKELHQDNLLLGI